MGHQNITQYMFILFYKQPQIINYEDRLRELTLLQQQVVDFRKTFKINEFHSDVDLEYHFIKFSMHCSDTMRLLNLDPHFIINVIFDFDIGSGLKLQSEQFHMTTKHAEVHH